MPYLQSGHSFRVPAQECTALFSSHLPHILHTCCVTISCVLRILLEELTFLDNGSNDDIFRPGLPIEIILRIFKIAAAGDHQDALVLSSVSREARLVAAPFVNSSVVLSTETEVRSFASKDRVALPRGIQASQFVEHLWLSSAPAEDLSQAIQPLASLERCPSLKTLAIDAEALHAFLVAPTLDACLPDTLNKQERFDLHIVPKGSIIRSDALKMQSSESPTCHKEVKETDLVREPLVGGGLRSFFSNNGNTSGALSRTTHLYIHPSGGGAIDWVSLFAAFPSLAHLAIPFWPALDLLALHLPDIPDSIGAVEIIITDDDRNLMFRTLKISDWLAQMRELDPRVTVAFLSGCETASLRFWLDRRW